MPRVIHQAACGLLLCLALSACSNTGTSKSSRAWSLWRHGFSTEVDGNPIARASTLVYRDGELAGIARNRNNREYWFRAQPSNATIELMPVAEATAAGEAPAVTIEKMLAAGGRVVATNSIEAQHAMRTFEFTHKRVQRDYRHATGSMLGTADGVMVTPAFAPQNQAGSTDPSSRGGQ